MFDQVEFADIHHGQHLYQAEFPNGEEEEADVENVMDPQGQPDQEMPQAANTSMTLTPLERNLALNIKEALADTPGVDPVSDFMCAQLALIDGDDTESAVERVCHLQFFREEYGILNSVVDGMRLCKTLFGLMPGLNLSFSDDIRTGQKVAVFDNTKFCGNQIRSEEGLQSWLGTMYYLVAMHTSNFDAIRAGLVVVAECEGYDWKLDMDFKNLKKVWSELLTVYPISFQKIKYFNNGTTMNVVISMLKPFLPKALRSKIEFGCQVPQRLDQLLLVPSMEAANARMLAKIEAGLQERYANEQAFRL